MRPKRRIALIGTRLVWARWPTGTAMAADAVVGYDPGGDGAHGVAMLVLLDGKAVEIYTGTWDYAEEVIAWIKKLDVLSALGVDTLTCWSTGPAAWRPADRWLRRTYPEVRNSVMTPNGLAGSMGLNGMGVIIETRALFPGAAVVETHPKVLHWALSGRRYAQSPAT